MPKNTRLSKAEIDEIKATAFSMTGDRSGLTTLYEQYKNCYFMENAQKPKGMNIDEDDIKVTISPNGRNAVTGMKRLLDTSEVHISIKSNGEEIPASSKIERGLKRILDQSGAFKRARIERDLSLSAVLFGPVILAAESVDDLILQQKKPIYKKRYQDILRYTPFLLSAISPEESYSRWGQFGQIAHLRKHTVTGDALMDRWGVDNLPKNAKYTIWDWIDLENRVAWMDGREEVLVAKPHRMSTMNISTRFAGGSSLFDESDKYMQSFLYAHIKGEWDKRENLFWTYLFTAVFMQGLPGPLLVVDPASVEHGASTLDIDYSGGVRKIFAKAQAMNFPVVDSDVLRVKELMDSVHAESTIYKQTLGQSIEGSTFSGLAMLSSAGQLPLEDPKEALTFCYRDTFHHILCRVKEQGMKSEFFSASDIPDQFEVEVILKPNLPQDNLRNAQIVNSLGDKVSDEWMLSNILNVSDPKAMRKQVMREQLLKNVFGAMVQDPSVVQQLMAMIFGKKQQQPTTVQGSGADLASTEAAVPAAGEVPGQMVPPGVPNMESMPATEPMPIGAGMGGGNGTGQ